MFRFDVGPVGAGWLGWGIPLGAAFVLFVAREARLDWATRWWVAAVATVVVAYAGGVGWLGAGAGATLVLLAPAACCLAAAVGLGVAAFEVDLTRSRFGWRQNLSVGAGLCLVVGLFPVLVSSVDGRSSLPSVGYEQILGWTTPAPGAKGYDVLWLGDPASVPQPAWQIRPGLAFAMSEDGLPDGQRLWPSSDPGIGADVEADLVSAEAGLTVRLGAELARVGVRYVILPGGIAPDLPGVQVPPSAPVSPSLVKTLQGQSDFRQLPTEGGVLGFEDTAWTAAAQSRAQLCRDASHVPRRHAGLAARARPRSRPARGSRRRCRGRRPPRETASPAAASSDVPPGDGTAVFGDDPPDGSEPSPARHARRRRGPSIRAGPGAGHERACHD